MWDCDSITQAKEKVLDVLFRNTPVSKRPQLTGVDLGKEENLTVSMVLTDVQTVFVTLRFSEHDQLQ